MKNVFLLVLIFLTLGCSMLTVNSSNLSAREKRFSENVSPQMGYIDLVRWSNLPTIEERDVFVKDKFHVTDSEILEIAGQPTNGELLNAAGDPAVENSRLITLARIDLEKKFKARHVFAGAGLDEFVPSKKVEIVRFVTEGSVYRFEKVARVSFTIIVRQGSHEKSVEVAADSTTKSDKTKFSDFVSIPIDDSLLYFFDPIKKYRNDANLVKVIEQRKFFIGMPAEALKVSIGEPQKINSTVTSRGRNEQWIYPSSSYFYLDQGILTSYQLSN